MLLKGELENRHKMLFSGCEHRLQFMLPLKGGRCVCLSAAVLCEAVCQLDDAQTALLALKMLQSST